jgi:hypothetical protein
MLFTVINALKCDFRSIKYMMNIINTASELAWFYLNLKEV